MDVSFEEQVADKHRLPKSREEGVNSCVRFGRRNPFLLEHPGLSHLHDDSSAAALPLPQTANVFGNSGKQRNTLRFSTTTTLGIFQSKLAKSSSGTVHSVTGHWSLVRSATSRNRKRTNVGSVLR